MDIDIKTAVEKLNEIVEWLTDTWRNGTWGKRLILLVAVLLFFKSPVPSSLGFPYELPAAYNNYYWSTVCLLIVIALIIEFRRPRVPNNPSVSVLEKNSAIRDLYAFDFDDADIFKQLQRGVMLDKVTNALINPAFKFGILYGESGCGKTSFLKAGLCAALKQNGHYQAIYIKFDKESPETYLYSALQKALQASISPPLANHDLLSAVLNQNNDKGIVFIFDQFEQFFLHQPQPEQRIPFIQLLASWYQTDKPVKILIGIRRDYFSYAMEIAPEINAEFEHINQKQVFKLLNFTVTEATAVFKVLAQTADLAFDESAVEEICRKELAKQDNLILPADIQILASVIRDLPMQDNHGKLGFNRDTFLKVGGVEGLLNNFLKNNLEILPVNKRKTVLKVLRALIDRTRNLRAGELTLEEIQSKASDISLEDIKDALEWSAGTRLIFTIEAEQLHINKYQLTHEKLIPSVLALVGELSDDVEKANTLLERRTNEWLGNQRVKRFLLNFNELRLIDKQKLSLVWGDNQRDKEALITASRRRYLTNVAVYAVLPVLAMSGYGLWWLSPRGQIYECEGYLNDMVKKATDDEKDRTVWQALTNSEQPRKITRQNLRIKHIYQLEYLHKSIIEKIANVWIKAYVFKDLAAASGSLDDKTQGLVYLTQVQRVANKIADEERKSNAFKDLAVAAGSLGDKTQGLVYLTQAQTVAEKIVNEWRKSVIFKDLAVTAGSLGDKTQGLVYLTQAQTAAEKIPDEKIPARFFQLVDEMLEIIGNQTQGLADLKPAFTDLKQKMVTLKISNERSKTDFFLALAAAAGLLDDKMQGLAYLTQAQTAAEKIADERVKADVFQALVTAVATLGDKRQGLAYLMQLQAATDNFADEKSKATVFIALATAAGILGDKTLGSAYLTQAQTAAEKIPDEESKAYVFQALATAEGTLGDKTQGLAYLTQAQTTADKIANQGYKTNVFKALATTAATLGDKTLGLAYLTQAQTAAENYANERNKAYVLLDLATAAGTLGDPEKALQFSQHAMDVVKKAKASDSYVFLNNAELNAQAGNYRTACNLAHDVNVTTGESLKILAVVLREYTQKHRL